MKTQNPTAPTLENPTPASTAPIGDARITRPLAEREIEQVAAAGGKGGSQGGDIHHCQ